MNDYTCEIIENRFVGSDCYLMRLACTFEDWRPGQFIMLQVNSGSDPYLRRPFGILSVSDGCLEIFYRIKGDGTKAMASTTAGDRVKVLGPLGNGFEPKNGDNILIAGGTGLPPIMALASSLPACTLIVGSRAASDMPLRERLEAMPNVLMVTEDGSLGRKGLVTDLLSECLAAELSNPTIYACGPTPMLKAIGRTIEGRNVACQVSLEERMGCGFGVCSGCVVETIDGNQRVCKDGPVFSAADIVWR